MSDDVPRTFHFGDHYVTVDSNEFYDLIFEDPYGFCAWLLEHEGWCYLSQVCEEFHTDHVKMIGDWAEQEVKKLPEAIQHPQDGTVRDVPTLLRYLAGACHWIAANRRLDDANANYREDAPTIETEEAVRAAAKELIETALEYPPPYRDRMVQCSLAWADFVDRRWLQGLNIPPPWGSPKRPPQ